MATWGFLPIEQGGIVKLFKQKGFKVFWFDGNRPAALREFLKRGTVQEHLFYLQMLRIATSSIIDKIEPVIINTFDEHGDFKQPDEIVGKIISKV